MGAWRKQVKRQRSGSGGHRHLHEQKPAVKDGLGKVDMHISGRLLLATHVIDICVPLHLHMPLELLQQALLGIAESLFSHGCSQAAEIWYQLSSIVAGGREQTSPTSASNSHGQLGKFDEFFASASSVLEEAEKAGAIDAEASLRARAQQLRAEFELKRLIEDRDSLAKENLRLQQQQQAGERTPTIADTLRAFAGRFTDHSDGQQRCEDDPQRISSFGAILRRALSKGDEDMAFSRQHSFSGKVMEKVASLGKKSESASSPRVEDGNGMVVARRPSLGMRVLHRLGSLGDRSESSDTQNASSRRLEDYPVLASEDSESEMDGVGISLDEELQPPSVEESSDGSETSSDTVDADVHHQSGGPATQSTSPASLGARSGDSLPGTGALQRPEPVLSSATNSPPSPANVGSIRDGEDESFVIGTTSSSSCGSSSLQKEVQRVCAGLQQQTSLSESSAAQMCQGAGDREAHALARQQPLADASNAVLSPPVAQTVVGVHGGQETRAEEATRRVDVPDVQSQPLKSMRRIQTASGELTTADALCNKLSPTAAMHQLLQRTVSVPARQFSIQPSLLAADKAAAAGPTPLTLSRAAATSPRTSPDGPSRFYTQPPLLAAEKAAVLPTPLTLSRVAPTSPRTSPVAPSRKEVGISKLSARQIAPRAAHIAPPVSARQDTQVHRAAQPKSGLGSQAWTQGALHQGLRSCGVTRTVSGHRLTHLRVGTPIIVSRPSRHGVAKGPTYIYGIGR